MKEDSTTRYAIGPFETWSQAAGVAWSLIKDDTPFVYTPRPPTLHVNPTDKQAAKLMEDADALRR